MKPVTPGQIAEFMARWHDAAFTLTQIAQHYRCAERTVQDWRKDFGLRTRPEALREAAKAKSALGAAGVSIAAKSVTALTVPAQGTMVEGQTLGTRTDLDEMDPLKDPEIVQALREIEAEARQITSHSDLTPIQRRLTRLSILVASKAPIRSWGSMQEVAESLSRALLHARRVEAEIPRGDVD
jgi:hypothetical protein